VERGSVGLVINRRTDVPISRVFEDFKEAKGRKEPVYIGGPVELNSVLALLKSPSKPTIAERVFGDVFLVSDKSALKATLASSAESNAFHVYVGYAGWGPRQLEHEVELGAWHIMRPDSATVFQDDPDSVWERMIRRTETQIARSTYTPQLPSRARR
jgi:putative transcriptional regulator